jgi:hypothetical protein
MTSGRRRDEADRLRAVPLESVLRLCGAEPDRHDGRKWHTPAGVLSVTGTKFMNWSRGVGGGGAIDLVIHLMNLGFGDALDWLASRFSSNLPLGQMTTSSPPPLRLPIPDPGKLGRVRQYLIDQRGIAAAMVDSLVRCGSLYADGRANAVFLLIGKENAPVGAELRGTTPHRWRGMAPGSRKNDGFFCVPRDSQRAIILCESAIDAISCSLLHPQHRCVSTSGARPDPPWLAPMLARGQQIYCGFDADSIGDRMAREMIALHPAVQRLRPSLHDWNDVLRSRS